MKTENGWSLAKFFDSYNENHQYKGIQIVQKMVTLTSFLRCGEQLLQSLVDNFEQRFPASDFLQAIVCLNHLMWPNDPLQRALFGERFVAELCKCFHISSTEACPIVVDYAVFKQRDGSVTGKSLKLLFHSLEALPVSSADCEQGVQSNEPASLQWTKQVTWHNSYIWGIMPVGILPTVGILPHCDCVMGDPASVVYFISFFNLTNQC